MKKFFNLLKGISLWAAMLVALVATCQLPTCINQGNILGSVYCIVAAIIGIFWTLNFTRYEWETYSGYNWFKHYFCHDKD